MRMGIIGLGTAGQRHAVACRRVPEVVLTAAADPSPTAVAVAEQLGIPCYPDQEQMLAAERLDAAIVSLPHGLLSAAGVACAQRGLHVLLEKPMGVTVGEAEAVNTVARRAQVRLMVNFVHRFRAEYRHAKDLIEGGAIGQPLLILDVMASGKSELPGWVWDRQLAGGGMMMYNGVHSIDRLIWLAGSPIAQASATMRTFSYPVELEDNVVGHVAFHSGGLGVVIQHKSAAATTIGSWETMVWGTRGGIKIITGGGLELASEKARAHLDVQDDDRFLGAVREFVSAVAEGRDPCPGGEDGRQALAGVLALYEAARTGRTQELPV
jgi:predicted dehydrogenase